MFEDVKTFLRIVIVLIPMGAIIILTFYSPQTAILFSKHINSGSLLCYAYQAISGYFPLFIIIPMYEFFIHSVLYNYIPSMLTRVGIWTIFIALSNFAFFIIDLTGHRTEFHEQGGSMNYTCLFDVNSPPHQLSINPLLALLPGLLSGLAGALVTIAVYEFVFSQSPYNMKGLLMGAIFATTGTFQLFGLVMQFPFHLGFTDHLTTFPTCGSVYTLLLLALGIVWFVVYVCVLLVVSTKGRGRRPNASRTMLWTTTASTLGTECVNGHCKDLMNCALHNCIDCLSVFIYNFISTTKY